MYKVHHVPTTILSALYILSYEIETILILFLFRWRKRHKTLSNLPQTTHLINGKVGT